MLKEMLAPGIAILLSLVAAAPSSAADPKPRIIVLTDISPITVEPDDFESMIRLMVHADLFQIEGLVATTGWSNSGGNERPDIIKTIIGAYEKDSPNLLKRSGQEGFRKDESHQAVGYWPSPDSLRARTVTGSRKMGMQFIGPDNDSPGSDLIIKVVDEKDDRPVYVLTSGGANTLAQGIWKVQKERTPEQLKEFLHKVRVYTITDQDRPQRGNDPTFSSHFWMRKEFRNDLKFIWDESAWKSQNGAGRSNWDKYAADVQGKGNLGAIYPKYRVMPEAGSYAKDITLAGSDTNRATLTIPEDAAGKSFHVIAEVIDNGTPPLTSYRRIIVSPVVK